MIKTAIVGLVSFGLAVATYARNPVVYNFNDGTALDQAGVGASMVVSNVTITTVDIVGQDRSRASDGVPHKTNIYGTWNALGINDANVSGTEFGNFDSGEAWIFTIDRDVYLSQIDLAAQGPGAELTISSSAFPDIVLPYVNSTGIHDLGNTFVPAGTEITFEMTSPTNAADTSLRIATFSVMLPPPPQTTNGTLYTWLNSYYPGLVTAQDYENADVSDTDADGMPAWKEYRAGTIPTNAASVLKINFIQRNGTNCSVTWQSVTNKFYKVLSATNLTDDIRPWRTISGIIAGMPAATVCTSTVTSTPASFFKVEVRDTDDVREFVLPTLISSNMVLQRDKPMRLWGWAEPNQLVSAVLEREGNPFSADTVTDAQGRWEILLPPQTACTTPCTLTFTTGAPAEQTVVLTDILIGDVWVISGQSNAEKKVDHLLEAAQIIALADSYDQIRANRVHWNVQYEPQEEANAAIDPWYVVDSSNVGPDVSAVAYCFALKVYDATNVPIGLLQSYRGGTEIETWLSADIILNDPDLAMVRERNWADPALDPDAAHYTVNYNGQIHPLIKYAIKGVLWYQGESNAKRALEYKALQKALVQDWRDKWNCGPFPFLYVQLFNMGPTGSTLYEQNNWCDIRDQQLSYLLSGATNTAMAVSIDTNEDPNNPDPSIRIHPHNKKPIGDRLGLLALKDVYGQDIIAESPVVESYSIASNTVAITFKNVGAGLKIKDGDPLLKGFVSAGSNQVFYQAAAQIVSSNVLRITSSSVSSPVTVRYGWAKNPDCNLYNSADLPASPFRLDNWPSQYPY